MHESTVSRVTSNKYLSCERGLFELKYFFTSGIQRSDGGDAASSEAVKSRIKALIAAEDADAILVRRPARRDAQGRRLRHRPAHRRQISRGDRARLLGPAPAAEGDRAGGVEAAIAADVVGLALLAACAMPEARLRAGLVNAGLSQPMAACMAERMVDRLSLIQLRRIGDLPRAREADSTDGFLHRVRSLRDPEILRRHARRGRAVRG